MGHSPQRGRPWPLRASLARSPPRLGRSQAGGLHPKTPRAAPWCAFAHRAPAASVIQQEGVPGTGATVAGVGNRLRLYMPDAQRPLAVFGLREISKVGPCRGTAGVRGRAPPL